MNRNRFILLLATLAFSASTAYSQLVRVEQPSTRGAITLIYKPLSGNLSLDTGGELLTYISITSQQEILTGMPTSYTPFADDIIDSLTSDGVLASTVGSPGRSLYLTSLASDVPAFGNLDFETIAEPNLTAEFLLTDLAVAGRFHRGGALDSFVRPSPHLFVVPEPSSMLICLSSLFAFGVNFRSSGRLMKPMQFRARGFVRTVF